MIKQSCKGFKAVYAYPENGYDHEKDKMKQLGFVVGNTYTVTHIDVGDWKTGVYLLEFPGVCFNSVFFDGIGQFINYEE